MQPAVMVIQLAWKKLPWFLCVFETVYCIFLPCLSHPSKTHVSRSEILVPSLRLLIVACNEIAISFCFFAKPARV